MHVYVHVCVYMYAFMYIPSSFSIIHYNMSFLCLPHSQCTTHSVATSFLFPRPHSQFTTRSVATSFLFPRPHSQFTTHSGQLPPTAPPSLVPIYIFFLYLLFFPPHYTTNSCPTNSCHQQRLPPLFPCTRIYLFIFFFFPLYIPRTAAAHGASLSCIL